MSEEFGGDETPQAAEGPAAGRDRPSTADWGPGTAVLGAIGALLAGILLSIPIAIIEPDVGSDDASAAANIALQFATVAGFLIVPILIATHGDLSASWTTLRRRLGINPFAASAIGWMVVTFFAYLAIAVIYAQLAGEPEQEDLAQLFGPIFFQVLLIVVFASIAEEVCFRGMLYGGLRNGMGVLPAALVTGIVFGIPHVTTGVSAVPVLVVLGAAFALLFEKTGSIVPGMILHAINNSLVLAAN